MDITKIVSTANSSTKEPIVDTKVVTPVLTKLDGVDTGIKEEKSKNSNGESNHPGREEINKELVQKQVTKLNKVIQATSKHIEYRIHEETDTFMVNVVDSETEEVIKEIPSEKVLDMIAKIEEMIGLLIDEKG